MTDNCEYFEDFDDNNEAFQEMQDELKETGEVEYLTESESDEVDSEAEGGGKGIRHCVDKYKRGPKKGRCRKYATGPMMVKQKRVCLRKYEEGPKKGRCAKFAHGEFTRRVKAIVADPEMPALEKVEAIEDLSSLGPTSSQKQMQDEFGINPSILDPSGLGLSGGLLRKRKSEWNIFLRKLSVLVRGSGHSAPQIAKVASKHFNKKTKKGNLKLAAEELIGKKCRRVKRCTKYIKCPRGGGAYEQSMVL